jgi:hypothetical protein
MELLPQSITFGIFPEDVPKLSLTIGRKGGVREWEPFYETRHIQVLLVQPDDGIDITNSQRRSMMQVIYAELFTNPCANISFIGGASPWGLMILTEGNAQMPFQEAMQIAGRGHPQALAAQATTPFRTEGGIRCWTTSP